MPALFARSSHELLAVILRKVFRSRSMKRPSFMAKIRDWGREFFLGGRRGEKPSFLTSTWNCLSTILAWLKTESRTKGWFAIQRLNSSHDSLPLCGYQVTGMSRMNPFTPKSDQFQIGGERVNQRAPGHAFFGGPLASQPSAQLE